MADRARRERRRVFAALGRPVAAPALGGVEHHRPWFKMVPARVRTLFWLPAFSLWRREWTRFVRQRSRIVGAIGTPIIFWLLLGAGLRHSFSPEGGASASYLEYAFPGMIVMVLLFTAIFSTISLIEDRREGFLQAVLASPAARPAIVIGKTLGSATLAVAQALLILLLGPLVGIHLSLGGLIAAAGVMSLVALGLSALGFIIAWRLDSTQGFHAVMNLLLMPMWLLSGALFPARGASTWLAWIMALNPLTYGLAAVRRVLQPNVEGGGGELPPLGWCLAITVGFGLLLAAQAVRMVKRAS